MQWKGDRQMQGNYFEPEIECASREVMHYIQSKKLVKMVEHAYNHVPLYKKRFDEIGLLPGDIQSIEDVKKLPFTYKMCIRDRLIPVCAWVLLFPLCTVTTRRAEKRPSRRAWR